MSLPRATCRKEWSFRISKQHLVLTTNDLHTFQESLLCFSKMLEQLVAKPVCVL